MDCSDFSNVSSLITDAFSGAGVADVDTEIKEEVLNNFDVKNVFLTCEKETI